ncbi:hypothetical protein [Neptuniibacter sp. QD48_11]|uniref:hypothetical protein n=1 Tax=Neptuniibacter sp. QD48_11 TaxID=3398211 RepID=UPI0039F49D5D
MMSKVVESAFGLALITGALFALSIANHNAYFAVIGVENGFVTWSSHQILYNALFITLIPSMQLLFFGFFGFGLLFVIAMGIDIWILRSFSFKRKLVICKQKREKQPKLSKLETHLIRWFKKFGMVVLICCSVFAALLYAEKQGRDRGLEFLADLEMSNLSGYLLVRMQGYPNPVVVISCGQDNCSGVDTVKREVIYFENKFEVGAVTNAIKTRSSHLK